MSTSCQPRMSARWISVDHLIAPLGCKRNDGFVLLGETNRNSFHSNSQNMKEMFKSTKFKSSTDVDFLCFSCGCRFLNLYMFRKMIIEELWWHNLLKNIP